MNTEVEPGEYGPISRRSHRSRRSGLGADHAIAMTRIRQQHRVGLRILLRIDECLRARECARARALRRILCILPLRAGCPMLPLSTGGRCGQVQLLLRLLWPDPRPCRDRAARRLCGDGPRSCGEEARGADGAARPAHLRAHLRDLGRRVQHVARDHARFRAICGRRSCSRPSIISPPRSSSRATTANMPTSTPILPRAASSWSGC